MKRFDQRNAFAEACPMCLPASHSLKIKNCWAHKRFTISISSAISIQLFQMASFFLNQWQLQGQSGIEKDCWMERCWVYGDSLSCCLFFFISSHSWTGYQSLWYPDDKAQCETVYTALGSTGSCIIHGKTFEHLDRPRTRCGFTDYAPSQF